MNSIRDLLSRDLANKIEEIIKVDQQDEQSVHSELTEYVSTEAIKSHYRKLFKAIADAPADPTEKVGVWVSGFFGSGKSSFAKNLGYVLSNQTVLGVPAADIFKAVAPDQRLHEFIDLINASLPFDALMFDVSVERRVIRGSESMAEIMYKVMLGHLGYAEDFEIAELEIELEGERSLPAFEARCMDMFNLEWNSVRRGAQRRSRASAVLYSLKPDTYPQADSWANSQRNQTSDITVGKFVERTYELSSRRRPGRPQVFIVDEVGQYVARSTEKIENLRAIVEQFGKTGKNLLRSKKAISPIWVVVTSQEKLDEIVAALDSRRVELAKLQDRFIPIDLAPTDIREVASKRVLAKKETAVSILKSLFNASQGQLNAACQLERTARHTAVNEAEFIQFYPYLPHFVELSIDIISGIRLQHGGSVVHLGGSNRTIIKQTYEMLVSDRTAIADKPVGSLVSLDKIFELVEGNLSTEKQRDISDIKNRLGDDPRLGDMIVRVAKAICLLEFVRDLPRTERNIAAVLVNQVGQAAPIAEVHDAIEKLVNHDFIIQKDEGFELLTPTDKNWQKEKKGYLDPRPRERHELIRSALEEIFTDPQLKIHKYKDIRSFKLGITFDGNRIGEGDIPFFVYSADGTTELGTRLISARDDSRQEAHKNEVIWVFPLSEIIHNLVAGLYASREMVRKYDQLRSQTRISPEESECLQNERTESQRFQKRLHDKLLEALVQGTGFFRGVQHEGSSLGASIAEIVRKLLDTCIPDLYPKLQIGARSMRSNEPELLLTSTNLSGLPLLFYDGDNGLKLVIKDGSRHVPNPNAPAAKELLDYLNREQDYGNRDTRTGKALETKFGGLEYGWELDMIRLLAAVLFRAGVIEVSHGGNRYDSYLEPQSRLPFTNTPAFRSSLFTPMKPPDLRELTKAVERYEELTGRTVEVERNSIATASKQYAEEEEQKLLPVLAIASANALPVIIHLSEFQAILQQIRQGSQDECVRILAGEGASIKELRDSAAKISKSLNDAGLDVIRLCRCVKSEMWPDVQKRIDDQKLIDDAAQLEVLLASTSFYESIVGVPESAKRIAAAYRHVYEVNHEQRAKIYAEAVETIKGRVEWLNVPDAIREPLLNDLVARACEDLDLPDRMTVCKHCNASLRQMETDITALEEFKRKIILRLKDLTTTKARVEHVRISEFFTESVDSKESVEEALSRLRDHLLRLLEEDVQIVIE